VKDLERGSFTRLTFTPGLNTSPTWTPDGKAIVYRNTSSGLYWIPSDGSGQAQRLADAGLGPRSFSPDGKILVGTVTDDQRAVFTATLEGDGTEVHLGKPQKSIFATAAGVVGSPKVSPDGKWIAYDSSESGQEVYVRPFPGPGGRWQISTGGGQTAHWSRSSNELFYESPQGIMVLGYSVSGDAFVPGKSRVWAPVHPSNGRGPAWDLASDGKRIVFLKNAKLSAEAGAETELTFLVNFFDELKRRIK
jgi:serine/threonine-protein kinase